MVAYQRGMAGTHFGVGATTLNALGVVDMMIQQILRNQNVSVTRKRYIKTMQERSVAAMANWKRQPWDCALDGVAAKGALLN
jgi:hypothetical protein